MKKFNWLEFIPLVGIVITAYLLFKDRNCLLSDGNEYIMMFAALWQAIVALIFSALFLYLIIEGII